MYAKMKPGGDPEVEKGGILHPVRISGGQFRQATVPPPGEGVFGVRRERNGTVSAGATDCRKENRSPEIVTPWVFPGLSDRIAAKR